MTTHTPIVIRDFSMLRPRYETSQDDALEWIAAAHAASETTRKGLSQEEQHTLHRQMVKLLERYGCSSDRIGWRASMLADTKNIEWCAKEIFNLDRNPAGEGIAARMAFFEREVTEYFRTTYAPHSEAPADLIHVTCTGYISPSPAQVLVAERGWSQITRVTHAYHMGCYAAIPALRIAQGFALVSDINKGAARRVDIIHSELCTLHLNPSDHSPEQLVVQSLFGDGLIRYSITQSEQASGFELLALTECIVPDTSKSMRWGISEDGMHMTLARDVPERIASALRSFVTALYEKAGIHLAKNLSSTLFAVHPGGPKIIDQVCAVLELSDVQVAASRSVLYDYGNMSSATLPHVWMRILQDETVRSGSLVLSLAFGPGLTLCGSIFKKR